MSFANIIQIEGVEEHPSPKATSTRKRSVTTLVGKRGCEYCTLNKVKGVKKIFGKVRGKRYFIWSQSPNRLENEEGQELLGEAGSFLWEELAEAGITRAQCDVQNVVRCFPADRDELGSLRMRNPSKEEVKCCSIYNDRALDKSEAHVHLVFGQLTAQALLGSEYRKDRHVFWSERLSAWVVTLDHPAFFVKGGSRKRLDDFRKLLRAARRLGKQPRSKYGFLEARRYIGVTTAKGAKEAYRDLSRIARRGERLSADLEEGWVDKKGRPVVDPQPGDRSVALVYGFCGTPGTVYVFALDHPDAPVKTDVSRRVIRRMVKRLLTKSKFKKLFHHGSYDVPRTKELLGYTVRGYDYDTNFSEFFSYVDVPPPRSYALANIAHRRFPQFAGYKTITAPECFTKPFLDSLPKNSKLTLDAKYEMARKKGGRNMNYALVPWKKMVLYNGADNDLQKRLEVTTRNNGRVPMPLMHVYMDASFVLDRMEKDDSPFFDYWHHDRLTKLFPIRRDELLGKLKKIARKVGVPWAKKLAASPKMQRKYNIKDQKQAEGWIDKYRDFNPDSPPQVSRLIYDILKLPQVSEIKNTQKDTMELMKQYHPFPGYQTEYKQLAKICSTYLAGFKYAADYSVAHGKGPRCRTAWWLTGTRTGRLSSGGGPDGLDGVVNLQNVHGDPQLQNLLISDLKWRKMYLYWKEHGDFKSDADIPDWILDINLFLGFDHAQMELRVVAQKSKDPELIKIFSTKQQLSFDVHKCKTCKKVTLICVHCKNCKDDCGCGDPHSLVGHALTGWPIARIKNDETARRPVKNMQFGIVYGLNENSLIPYMRAKGVTEEMASDDQIKEQYRAYFVRFKRVKKMIENDRAIVEATGKVSSLFGFIRELDVHGDEGGAYWGNQAINTPIQGTAHQAMLIGIVPIVRMPEKYNLLQKPCMEIHDAMYFFVSLRNMWKAAKQGQYMLEKESINIIRKEFGIDWQVPFVAEPKGGFRFGVQVKMDKLEDKTISAFLNAWCRKNKESEIKLKKEMRKLV